MANIAVPDTVVRLVERLDRNREAAWILLQPIESGRCPDFPILDADFDRTELDRKKPANVLRELKETPANGEVEECVPEIPIGVRRSNETSTSV